MCAPGNVNARKASVGPTGPSIAKGKALQGRDNARRILLLSKLLNELNKHLLVIGRSWGWNNSRNEGDSGT